MIDTTTGRLLLLASFSIDYTLPKYTRAEEASDEESMEKASFSSMGSTSMRQSNRRRDSLVWGGNSAPDGVGWLATSGQNGVFLSEDGDTRSRPRWYVRAWRALMLRLNPPPKPMTVLEFFSHMKNSTEELLVVEDAAARFEHALTQARLRGQQALLEGLLAGADVARAEAQLAAAGEKKYIEEKTIVAFVKQSERGLRLDYLRNFMRPIPDEMAEKKLRLDALDIFDNYAVLHYDPENRAVAPTVEERIREEERKRDPIFFGLIKGSTRLYYLGDWIDEYCDLTLEKIVEKLGESSVREL